MPISKSGRKYFTKQQLKQAQECSALEYARQNHYHLIKQGSRYIHRDHDSMVFLPDGRWYWNSRSLQGRALDLMVEYEGYALVDAVLLLAGDERGDAEYRRLPAPLQTPKDTEPPEPVPFVLPARSKTQVHLFAYLCKYRKLDSEIIRNLIHSRRLYEGVYRYKALDGGQTRECYNAVFLGLNDEGVPLSAYQRGASSNSTFKHEVPGSKKLEHPFIIPGHPAAASVGFFEGCIDGISHATLFKHSGVDYMLMERVAMGGISAETVELYLFRHPEKKEIHLCLDADWPGEMGAARIEAHLRDKGFNESAGYQYSIEQVPAEKDWNAYLKAITP